MAEDNYGKELVQKVEMLFELIFCVLEKKTVILTFSSSLRSLISLVWKLTDLYFLVKVSCVFTDIPGVYAKTHMKLVWKSNFQLQCSSSSVVQYIFDELFSLIWSLNPNFFIMFYSLTMDTFIC